MGLKGTLSELPLTALVEMTSLAGKTGRLLLYGPEGRLAGELAFDRGRLADAMYGELEPTRAFFALLGVQRGSFVFETADAIDHARCDLPTTSLLIDGMRRLDEARLLRRQLEPSHGVRWQGGAPQDFAEASVLARLAAGDSTVEEVVEAILGEGQVDEHDVLTAIQRLSERGVLRLEGASGGDGQCPPGSE
jgi:hypothetical protein